MDKRILIGFHYPNHGKSTALIATARGYQPVIAEDLDEMMAEARTLRYSRVIMDANFGFPGSINISPSVQVYELFKSLVEQSLVKFLAISGDDEIVRLAKSKEIPAEVKGIMNLVSFLS